MAITYLSIIPTTCNFRSCLTSIPRPSTSTLFPYTTLFRSSQTRIPVPADASVFPRQAILLIHVSQEDRLPREHRGDRKSTRLNSSHVKTSYAVFCLKKKTKFQEQQDTAPQTDEHY